MNPAPVADLAAARRRRLGLCGLCGAPAGGALACQSCVDWHHRITRILERVGLRPRVRRGRQ